jgi:hypothetical protein
VLTAIVAVASLAASTPATADPIYQGHFHDVFTNAPYDCEGTPAQNSGDEYINFVYNLRGSSPFPIYRESTHGTLVMTSLTTGGTFTNADFRTATSALGSGELEAELASTPPWDGGVVGEIGVAEDG